jgi:hypothetical protein
VHGEAHSALHGVLEDLREALALRNASEQVKRLGALEWSLADAPEVGFALLTSAGDRFGACGRMQADDFVEDARLSFEEMRTSGQHSRFARESIIRYGHASGDLLAQVVNGAVGDLLSERDCSLSRLAQKLQADFAPHGLALAVDDFAGSPSFIWVDAACNRLKHRTILPGGVSAAVDEVSSKGAGRILVTHDTGAFVHNDAEFASSNDADLRRHIDVLRDLASCVLRETRAMLP